uniref:Uncharacterized protein n=1 Tax=Rhizophora mucronata TaxID=61149 RepID=A0A2P2P759_RHIMU
MLDNKLFTKCFYCNSKTLGKKKKTAELQLTVHKLFSQSRK